MGSWFTLEPGLYCQNSSYYYWQWQNLIFLSRGDFVALCQSSAGWPFEVFLWNQSCPCHLGTGPFFFFFGLVSFNSLAANGLVTGVQKQEVEFLRHHSFGGRDTLSMPPLCCFVWVFGIRLVSSAYLARGRIAPGPSLPLISRRVT